MGIADWGLAATAPLINRGGILYGPLEEVSGVGSYSLKKHSNIFPLLSLYLFCGLPVIIWYCWLTRKVFVEVVVLSILHVLLSEESSSSWRSWKFCARSRICQLLYFNSRLECLQVSGFWFWLVHESESAERDYRHDKYLSILFQSGTSWHFYSECSVFL